METQSALWVESAISSADAGFTEVFQVCPPYHGFLDYGLQSGGSGFASFRVSGPGVNVFRLSSGGDTIHSGPRYLRLSPGIYTIEGHASDFQVSETSSFNESSSTAGATLKLQSVVDADFVVIPIHGQIPDAFWGLTVTPPAWSRNDGANPLFASLHEKMLEVNAVRNRSCLGRVALAPWAGDWAELTVPGAPELAQSRVLYLLACPFPGFINPAFWVARYWEARGRDKTSKASLRAASILADEVRSVVDRGTTITDPFSGFPPTFVDIIAHSRGAAVASEMLRILSARGAFGRPVRIAITYLDAIDPDPANPDLQRPKARAGHLLGDPRVRRWGSEQISAFYAEYGIGDLDLEDAFWGVRLAAWIVNLVGCGTVSDEWLVDYGYPRGHSRLDLAATSNELVPGSNHSSLANSFIDSAIQHRVGEAATSSFNYVTTTYIGRLMENPAMEIESLVVEQPSPRLHQESQAGISDFVQEGTFSGACAFLRGAEALLSDSDVTAVLSTSAADVYEALVNSVEAVFPAGSAWTRLNESVVIRCEPSTDAFADFVSVASLIQEIDPRSRFESLLQLEVDIEFVEPEGKFAASVQGHAMNSTVMANAESVGIAVRRTLVVSAHRSTCDVGSDLDRVQLDGQGVHVFGVRLVALSPTPGDVNGDGIVNIEDMEGFTICMTGPAKELLVQTGADLDGDADVDLLDFQAMQLILGGEQ